MWVSRQLCAPALASLPTPSLRIVFIEQGVVTAHSVASSDAPISPSRVWLSGERRWEIGIRGAGT